MTFAIDKIPDIDYNNFGGVAQTTADFSRYSYTIFIYALSYMYLVFMTFFTKTRDQTSSGQLKIKLI